MYKRQDNDHFDKVSNDAAVALRVSCKRTASKDISERLHKIIRTALQSAVKILKIVSIMVKATTYKILSGPIKSEPLIGVHLYTVFHKKKRVFSTIHVTLAFLGRFLSFLHQ